MSDCSSSHQAGESSSPCHASPTGLVTCSDSASQANRKDSRIKNQDKKQTTEINPESNGSCDSQTKAFVQKDNIEIFSRQRGNYKIELNGNSKTEPFSNLNELNNILNRTEVEDMPYKLNRMMLVQTEKWNEISTSK